MNVLRVNHCLVILIDIGRIKNKFRKNFTEILKIVDGIGRVGVYTSVLFSFPMIIINILS